MDTLAVDSQLVDQASAAVLRVHNYRVEAVVQTLLRGQLARPGLAREHVVGGQHERTGPPVPDTSSRQQIAVEVLYRQPLEVHDVSRSSHAAIAQHVRHVLGQLAEHAHTSARCAQRGSIEELVAHISIGLRDGPIGEAARKQLHRCVC